ncbi:homeotic protein female sterile [Trichonephila clavipes]|nr:homeotic protein female sterile [Trichonephila clavipes]
MAYLGKGRREDLFVLATELNLKFDKSMTIATLKDLIIGSEDYDEELTKNIHSTIVEDRKAREENLRIEEQKEKLRIEEREEKLRFEQLRKVSTTICHSPKAPERTWIDFYHKLNTYFNGWIDGLKIDTFNKLSDLIITDQLKRKTPFEFKEYYLEDWANMNSPVQLAEKLEEFENFKRTLKQKSSSPFVKKQEFRFTEKNRRYESPGKFEVKITALIDSGNTVSLLRENSSRRIMDPTKLSKNKMLLTGIGEAQVTTIGSFEHEFKIDDENYSLTWHVVPTDKLKFEAVIESEACER